MTTKQRVVIIGAGFAGLKAARTLANTEVDVLLIDKNNYHTFTPLLYQVATCGLHPSDVAYPVRSIFTGTKNVHFLLGEVTNINTSEQFVIVDADTGEERQERYDYLFIAAGSETNWFGNEQIKRNSFGLRDLSDAVALRHHILKLFEKAAWTEDQTERDALLTFIVVGGGPTGLETAGALYELYNHVLTKEYSNGIQFKARVILLEAMDDLLSPYPAKLRKSAKEQLASIGVEVYTGAFVDEVKFNTIKLKDGRSFDTYTIVWATGVVGSPLARMLNIELARGGRIPVEETMQVKDVDKVFAAGDTVYLEDPNGEPYPGLIPVAQQQGTLVAQNILRDIRGAAKEIFVYGDRGSMATIGRRRAVAWVYNRIQLTGFLAWVAWLLLHLVALLGMRNRILVFVNWIWDYFFYDRSVRLIIEGAEDKIRHPELFDADYEHEHIEDVA